MVQHECSEYANQTYQWIGSDTKENWRKNLLNEDHHRILIKNGWDNPLSIDYRFNSHGFRCAEWDQIQTHNIALGCSHTQGVGLPLKYTWPYKLSFLLKQSVLNLGVGGGSLDTCFRILNHYIDKIKISNVYLLEPEPYRFDFYLEEWKTLTVHEHSSIYKAWALFDENSKMNQIKNQLAIQQLCDSRNIKLVTLSCSNRPSFKNDWARDFAHNGIKWNERVALDFAKL